ncbi:MAG: hypothetical protein OXE59_12280 [Bacteroidetes bacterium]|nr:hypothetical protein [Bacteroidota bacterium]
MQSTTQSHIQADQWLDIEPRRIATILHVINRGWEICQKKPNVQSGTRENTLNECLRDGMRKAVNHQSSLGIMPKIQVLPTALTRSTDVVSEPDGAPDIPVSFPKIFESTHDHNPHAYIECKRIDGKRVQFKAYVEDGVDRFKSGQYGGHHLYGFMAAYLESIDTIVAVNGINQFLETKHRQGEKLRPAPILNAEWVRISQHPRERGTVPIEIHHVFLSFK